MISYGIMQGRLTPSKGRGIQFFPFDNWKEEFEISSRIGIEEIEFIFDYDNYVLNPLWSDDGIDKINHLIYKTCVKVRSLCFDYFMRRPFYKYVGEERERIRLENKTILLHVFASLDRIGGSLIEIPSVDNSSLKSDEEKEEYSEFLREIIRDTEDKYANIKIGLETDLKVEEFVDFIDNIKSDRVGANYDSGNSSGLGYDLYKEVTVLESRILNVHIKDRVYGGTTVALGTGSADFDALFKGLKEIGYRNSFIIQAARGIEGAEDNTIQEQRKFIESYVEKYCLE